MKKGFTLIELLLTVVVISAGLVGIMAIFENVTRGALQVDLNVTAANLAHEKLERIVMDKWHGGYDLLSATNYPDESFTGDFSIYTRNTTISEVSSTDFITPQLGSGYKKIIVKVSWGSLGNQQVSIPTVLASY